MKNKLPMKWWNFCKYFRFPVGIFISFITLLDCITTIDWSYMTGIVAIVLFLSFFYIFLKSVTYYNFIKETEFGYILLIIDLFFEAFYTSLSYALENIVNDEKGMFMVYFILYLAAYSIIFVCPSYIYFSKRKYIFETNENKDIQLTQIYERIEETKDINKLINIYYKKYIEQGIDLSEVDITNEDPYNTFSQMVMIALETESIDEAIEKSKELYQQKTKII